MRNATQKEIDNFIEYRANHVALVQRIGSVVFGIDISDHDKDKIEADGEELNLFSLRNSMLNGTYHPHKADRAKLKRLVGKHVKSQKHHPEYWDDSITARNFDDENPPQVNAHKMPKRYLLEMVCDWCAVALKLNKPLFNWYNKTCTGENARFLFTDNQKEYIIECISRVASKIKEENLHYPKIEYTAELDSPKIDFGKKLNESKEGIIYSKEFKDWFGDWENDPEHSSKVVDKDGKPLAVYHGSPNGKFDILKFSYEEGGIYFSDNKSVSESYFINYDDPSVNPKYSLPWDIEYENLVPSNEIYECYLNMRNPLIIDAKNKHWNEVPFNTGYSYPTPFGYTKVSEDSSTSQIARYAKKNNYDGVIIKNIKDGADKKALSISSTTYIVFNSNQIKSATDNNGNFSKKSDNIYEKILHKNNKWVVTDHTGKKNLGTYDTKEEAEKRLKQVEYFKHINENEEKDIDTKESFDVESTTVNEKVITSFGGKVPISNKDKDQILKFCKKAVEDGMKPTKYTEEDMSNSANFSSGSIASNAPENTRKVINLGAEKIEEAFIVCSLNGEEVEGTYTTDLNKAKRMRSELADTYRTFFKIERVPDIPNFENTEELKESTEKGKTCVFTFGRYQPPTKGHLKVWEKVADTEGDAHYIYTSHTKDKKKNPLDYNTKVGLIESALKENSINAEIVESEAKTIIDVVVDIANKGFTDIIFVGGSDRLNDIVTLIQKYNDVPNKEGSSYHFDTIEGVSAGERDPDSDSLEGVSGTKIRQFALDNDFESFKDNLAFSDESTAKEVMEIIKANIKK